VPGAARHTQTMRAQEIQPLAAHPDETIGELRSYAWREEGPRSAMSSGESATSRFKKSR
jgi:hypothetical protein